MIVKRFAISPHTMEVDAFVARFGGVYEHSPWIALKTWQQGLGSQHGAVDTLAATMAAIVMAADDNLQLALIKAHPDLAGKAAARGELTEDSTSEQSGAGIDQCSDAEFERFQGYNEAYQLKFGFPFIMAVKGSNRHLILAAFEQRLGNDLKTEKEKAIEEIHKIARFRLEALAAKN